MEKYKLKRRSFIKSSALTAVGLTIGFSYDPKTSLAVNTKIRNELGLWIRILSDGTITLIVPSSEMGQGVNTSLSMILAEELEANWESIKTETAPANSDYTNPESKSGQMTVGSSSIKGFWEPLRKAGASAKLMLKMSAAKNGEYRLKNA